MLKPGLGKGLGDLMHGDQVAGKDRPCGSVPAPGSTALGRGIKTLIHSDSTSPPTDKAPPTRSLLPAWFYFAADLLLLAFTIAIAFDANRPFDPGTVLFCAVSVSLGTTLAIIGVLQASKPAA